MAVAFILGSAREATVQLSVAASSSQATVDGVTTDVRVVLQTDTAAGAEASPPKQKGVGSMENAPIADLARSLSVKTVCVTRLSAPTSLHGCTAALRFIVPKAVCAGQVAWLLRQLPRSAMFHPLKSTVVVGPVPASLVTGTTPVPETPSNDVFVSVIRRTP